MSLPGYEQAFDGLCRISSRGDEPYEPSITSTAPSSQASVFSDTDSGHSSIASSISDDFRLSQDEARDRACAQAQVRLQASQGTSCHTSIVLTKVGNALKPAGLPLSYADVTSAPLDQRQHPRRSSLARHQKPPSLQRQQDRKIQFVDGLVDSASQMVEVIWPLSGVACKAEGPAGRGVLPLRTYIEETLRRSRTSYSTLQVALYYLVLIKPFVPKSDFTKEQSMDCPASRALMCGRRMFLAALILASKYLQDRNYSAKAWSKMSGLSVPEINTNERTFLAKVDFKLHIPEPIFARWTEIVLLFGPNTQPPPPGHGIPSWKSIIPLLTPALDTVPLPESKVKPRSTPTGTVVTNYGCVSLTTPTPTRAALNPMQTNSTSHETTPTPMTVLPPRFLEPKADLIPPTPALARLGPLPTPQLTPSSVAASTPAASACSSRRPSMCSAMSLAQQTSFNRCAMDTFPFSSCNNTNSNNSINNTTSRPAYLTSRRPSITSATSRSSPESMISDRSRSSRASSISSVSTIASNFAASLAPHHRADKTQLLALAQATCRGNNYNNSRTRCCERAMPPPLAPLILEDVRVREGGSAAKPIVIVDDAAETLMLHGPDFDATADAVCEKKKSHCMPDRHTKFAASGDHRHLLGTAGANAHHKSSGNGCNVGGGSRKRTRNSSSASAVPRGSARRSNLQEEVRLLLLEEQIGSMERDHDEVSSLDSSNGDEVEVVDLVDLDDENVHDLEHENGSEDVDEVMVSPSPAVKCASRLLAAAPSPCFGGSTSSSVMKGTQPSPSLSRRGSCRLPVPLRGDGSKRFCRTAST